MRTKFLALFAASAALIAVPSTPLAAAESQPAGAKAKAGKPGSTARSASRIRPSRSVYVNRTPPNRKAANVATAQERAANGRTAQPPRQNGGTAAAVVNARATREHRLGVGNNIVTLRSRNSITSVELTRLRRDPQSNQIINADDFFAPPPPPGPPPPLPPSGN